MNIPAALATVCVTVIVALGFWIYSRARRPAPVINSVEEWRIDKEMRRLDHELDRHRMNPNAPTPLLDELANIE